MNTDELLKKIGKLFEAELEHTRKVVREEVGAAETRLSESIATTKNEINATLERDAEAIAGFFHQTWEKIEATQEETNERISIIEDNLGLTTPPKKN